MKKSAILFLLFFILTGCIPVGYRMNMVKPVNSSVFEDDNIKIIFSIKQEAFMGVEGVQQYKQYSGITFNFTNKTDKTIIIDWNQISFKDYTGSSGRAVMHSGLKYNECSNLKAPTTVPAKGQFSDIIIPCYALEFKTFDGFAPARWNISMLPSPRQCPKIQFGFFVPLKIGENTVDYNFEFQAIAD